MALNACLVFSLCFMACSRGLELTFDRDPLVVPRPRAGFCGILTCLEDINTSSSSSSSDSDQPGSEVIFTAVHSMTVYKRASATGRDTTTSGGGGEDREVIMAAVTSQDPDVASVVDGVQVNGRLDDGQATLRLELTKQEDSLAEFACQVRGLDSQGREAVSVARLVQGPGQSRVGDVDGGQGSVTSLQLLASMQQLVTQSVTGLVTTLQDTINQQHKEVIDRSEAFEHRVEDRLLSFENRVEDKIDNNNNLNKLIQLDAKVSTELAQFRSEAKAELLSSLNSLASEVGNELDKRLKNISESFQGSLERAVASLSSVETGIRLLQTRQDQLENATKTVQELLETEDARTQHACNVTATSHVKQIRWFRLINAKVDHIKDSGSDFEDLVRDTTAKAVKDLKTFVNETVGPTVGSTGCGKGYSPYPVIPPKPGRAGKSTCIPLYFPYPCDMETEGGDWIIIQRRTSGDTDFNRNWADYKLGFGSFSDNFWLGNDNLHDLTEHAPYELRVELEYKGKTAFAKYSRFSVSSEAEKYKLTLGEYSGTAGDSLAYHDRMPFSTPDRDNDYLHGVHRARDHNGGWWFNVYDKANLNGKWGQADDKGLEWKTFAGADTMSYSEMKIRRVD